MKPASLGQIVHYTKLGACDVAIITRLHENGWVGCAVFYPDRMGFVPHVPWTGDARDTIESCHQLNTTE